MMRRLSAMPWSSSSLMCLRRSSISGALVRVMRRNARDVELGSRQQGAEFVVQLAGEVGAFVLADGLQVMGQFGQLAGAVRHLAVEPVALAGQLLGMLTARAVQGLVAAQEHGQPEQTQQRQPVHADAAVGERAEDGVALPGDLLEFVVVELADGVPNGLHLFAADVGSRPAHATPSAVLRGRA